MQRLPNTDLALGEKQFGQALAEWLFSGYILLVFAGFVVFRSSATMVHGNEMSVERAVFSAVNAATLTGFQQNVSTNDYLTGGQVTALILTIGGSTFSLVIGGLAAVRICRLPYSDRRVVAAAIFAQVLAVAAGGMVLRGAGQSELAAAQQAASAFGNSGLYSGSLPGVFDWRTHLVLLPLAVGGGLGLSVLVEVYDWALGRRMLSGQARTVLNMTAGVYLVGTAALLALQGWGMGIAPWQTGLGSGSWGPLMTGLGRALVNSSTMCLDSRTLGMPFQAVHDCAPAMQWALVLLMVIGASPGGSGGGVKTTTVVELVRGLRRSLSGGATGRAFGVAATWAAGYAMIVVAAFLLILVGDPELPMPADRLLFLLISAASNVGLSHEPVALTRFPLDVLSVTMLAGRLVPLGMLWWMARTTHDAELLAA